MRTAQACSLHRFADQSVDDMILLQWILWLFALNAFPAPEPAPVDRWLIRLESDDATCLDTWWATYVADGYKKKLPVDTWWVVEVPGQLRASLEALPCLLQMQPDMKIDWRDRVPNDPTYISQSDMNLIRMPAAWGISTGGLTTRGDTIVVAVIDDGFQTDHPDLVENIWINHLEISGDGIDNDMNGYIDDRMGYNVSTENDSHPVKSHGTSVSGVIGATGNNGIGVAGVNWNIKLMLISGAGFESDVIMAYQYVLDMRNRYDQTGGEKGAFVVVTNLSGGINNAWAYDHPLWCEMYDKLGARGILSVTAAPNNPISVDVDGDMPTTCTSPYMIAVTNVDNSDVLVSNAGFGAESIDIGAQGHGTITTATFDAYKPFPGTSAAAPHVAGAVALLYSTPCTEFLDDLMTDPDGIAERVRDIIYATAAANNSLEEITVTGKRIDVGDAMLATTSANCGAPIIPEIQVVSVVPNPARNEVVRISFEAEGLISGAIFELFAANGMKILEVGVDEAIQDEGFIEIQGRDLPAGVYFLTLRFEGEKDTHKLVILN